jgi:hypothetical protein
VFILIPVIEAVDPSGEMDKPNLSENSDSETG